MAISNTTLSNLLKTRYTPGRLKLLGYRNNPLLAMMRKDEGFTGDNRVVGIWTAAGGAGSADYATAQGNVSDHVSHKFTVERVVNHAFHRITAEAIRSARGREDAFINAQMAMMDEVVHRFTRDVCMDLYRDGTGVRGRVGSFSVDTITLADRNDIVHFEHGMVLKWSGVSATGAVEAGQLVITKLNRNAGTITGTVSGGTTPAADDYLFREGDAADGGSVVKAYGLDAWIPAADPTSGDNFWGTDRSDDPQRLAGVRYDGSSQSIQEALIDAGTLAFEAGARPDYVFVNPVHRAELVKALDQKTEYQKVSPGESGNFFFKGVTLETGAGNVTVIADPNCPKGVAYMLQMDAWELLSLDGVPHVNDDDGLRMIRTRTADDFEMHLRAWYQPVCYAPGYQTRVTLSV